MAIPRLGLSNIRTISGKVNQVVVPYRAYMQVTCLEMEKARRSAERQSAMARVTAIDCRLAAIDQEKTALLRSVDEPGKGASVRHPEARPGSGARSSARGFKLRY
jgi:hypothetical protein